MTPARASRRPVPSFSLYGEQSTEARRTDSLHIEDIQSRSRKYLWRIGTHRHQGLCQCLFVASGPVTVDLEEVHAAHEGPALVIVPAGTVHGFAFGADTEGYVLSLDLDRLLTWVSAAHQAAITTVFAVPRAVQLRDDPALAERLGRLFAALLHEFRQPDSSVAPMTAWLACSVLCLLKSSCLAIPPRGAASRQDLDRVRRFRILIEAHYLDHWPVQRYAARLAMSSTSLNRSCRNLTGTTAFDVIQARLALEARRRLIHLTGSIASIAAELGFIDPAYFCRFFRKHNGQSPSTFRRRQAGA